MSDTKNYSAIAVECKIAQPEGFVPKNDEQDIAVMGPIFDSFDSLDYEFNQYDAKTIERVQENRDHNTAYFFEYYRVPQNGEDWSTLARWRYQNEELYKRFLFWRFITGRNCKNEVF